MFGKTPVTTLEEYCAKKNVVRPVYEFINSGIDKSFICRVNVLNQMEEGVGRSKKEAKHDASANMIKRLKFSNPDIVEIPQAPHETISITDAIAGLRDLCLDLNHPLPSFEIVQETGPSEAREFTAECCVATITRYGMASTKKAAKQKAAQQIIEIIKNCNVNEFEKQLIPLQEAMDDEDEEVRRRFKSYREFINSDVKVQPGILLADRHNFFKDMEKDIKLEAIQILNNDTFSDHDKVYQFLKKLGIKWKQSDLEVIDGKKLTFVELVCEFDACFAETNSNIWNHMLEYFKDMVQ